MTLILDTGPLVALADVREPRLAAVSKVLHMERGDLIVPAPITAEVDYFLQTRFGVDAARRFLSDAARGEFRVECLDAHEYAAALQVDRQYADLRLGLADLSIIILARRFDTRRILSFDARHFRAVEALQGGRFTLLPDDA